MVAVHMQVGNEDVANLRHWDAHGEDVLDAAGPNSKKKRLPLPNSTMMHVPAWSRRGGKGQLPTNEIRISSGPMVSLAGVEFHWIDSIVSRAVVVKRECLREVATEFRHSNFVIWHGSVSPSKDHKEIKQTVPFKNFLEIW